MTYEEMIQAIEALRNDADYSAWPSGDIHVDLNDFEGFDDNWKEIMREFDNEKAVDDFIEMLGNTCLNHDDGYYRTYNYNGFRIILGYLSYDI